MRPVRPVSRRRLLGAAIAVVAVAGLGTASAAQLGVTAGTLAAGAASVGDCQAGGPVRVQLVSGWSTTPSPDAFTTTGVVVHDISDACNGQELRVTLVDDDGDALAEAVKAAVSGAPGVQSGLTFVSVSGNPVLTASIAEAKVVIHS